MFLVDEMGGFFSSCESSQAEGDVRQGFQDVQYITGWLLLNDAMFFLD